MSRIYCLILLIVLTGCQEKRTITENTDKPNTNVSLDTSITEANNSKDNMPIDINSSVEPSIEDFNSKDNSSIDLNVIDINNSESNIFIDLQFVEDEMYTSSDVNDTETNSSEEIKIEDINITDINLSLESYFSQQWYLAKDEAFYTQNDIEDNASINASEMLKQYTGKGVTIAIIDDGLDVTHEELNGSLVASYDIRTRTSNVSHNRQGDYHGTAVTGIIAANRNSKGILGLARDSDIIFLKYKEGMSDSETIELFQKAEELGADIINCSWGTYDVSDSVKETIQDLAQNGRDGKGTLIVFAVGNDSRDMGNDESAIAEVIAVGSTDRENLRAWYSNYGENLDVLAPGGYEVGITTLDPMDTNGISTLDDNYLLATDGNSFIGSSAAAPIVSGVIALMLEKDPNLTRIEIEEMLKNSSDKIGNLEYEEGWNQYYGYGKINVQRVLEE